MSSGLSIEVPQHGTKLEAEAKEDWRRRVQGSMFFSLSRRNRMKADPRIPFASKQGRSLLVIYRSPLRVAGETKNWIRDVFSAFLLLPVIVPVSPGRAEQDCLRRWRGTKNVLGNKLRKRGCCRADKTIRSLVRHHHGDSTICSHLKYKIPS